MCRRRGNEKAPTFVEAFEDGAAPGVELVFKYMIFMNFIVRPKILYL